MSEQEYLPYAVRTIDHINGPLIARFHSMSVAEDFALERSRRYRNHTYFVIDTNYKDPHITTIFRNGESIT
jgi:hypothetical protein